MNRIKAMALSVCKRTTVCDSFLIIALAIVTLFVWFRFEDTKHYHLSTPMLTDQIIYTSTARNLLATGELDCNIIYLSMLDKVFTKNTFYMPGYPAILALSFGSFGYGVFQAILPSLISFVGGVWIVYLIGASLFNRKSGWISSLLFLAFPTNVLFSFTAMTEMVLVFLSLLSFYLFIRLPPGRRWIFGPVLVAGVFLIRETAALLVIFFAFFMLLQDWRKYWKETLLFCLSSFVLLVLIYISPLSSGRLPSSLFSEVVYNDLGPSAGLSTIGEFLRLLLSIGRQNFQSIGFPIAKDILMIGAVIGMSILGLLYGATRKRSLNYYFPVFVLVLIVTISIFFLSILPNFRGLRLFMFVIAFPLIGLGAVFSEGIDLLRKKLKPLPWVVVTIFLLTCVQQTWYMFSVLMPAGQTEYERQTVQLIEETGHDDRQVLVAPLNFAVAYVDKHYPVKYAFIPASDAAFELLNQKYQIGTLIYPVSIMEDEPGYISRMDDFGFTLSDEIRFDGITYLVFKP